MRRHLRLRGGLLWVGAALLGACAEVPPVPAPAPAASVSPQGADVDRAIARHRRLAQQATQSGDLATAAAQWQILTVLSPRDGTFRRELDETRAAIGRLVRDGFAAGQAALKRGETDRATDAMLGVLALDPGNEPAAQALRDIDRRRMARIQAGRAAKAGGTAIAAGALPPPAAKHAQASDPSDAYTLEQPLEMLAAGDTEGGLRDLRRFVDANPNDRVARNRIGTAVFDRAREVEAEGQRELALSLYEQAVSLRGAAAPGWAAHIGALNRAIADEYYEKGVKVYPDDAALAMRQWEASLRFDPGNAKAAARLKEARTAQEKGARAAK